MDTAEKHHCTAEEGMYIHISVIERHISVVVLRDTYQWWYIHVSVVVLRDTYQWWY